MPWLWILACAGTGETDTQDTELAEVTVQLVGPAPWDGVVVRRELDDLTPLLEGPDGTITGAARAIPMSISLWTGADGTLTPGDWTVVGLEGEPTALSEPFTVEVYGDDPDFDPTTLQASTYELDLSTLYGWGELAETQLETTQHLIVQLEPGDSPHLRWAFVDEEAGSCLLVDAPAELTERGTLTWTGDIDVRDDVLLEDVEMRLGLRATQDRIAGAELRFWLDTRALSAEVFPDEGAGRFCEFIEALGAGSCEACSDGVEACADTMALGMQLERIGEVDLSGASDRCDALIDWWEPED